MILAAVIMPLYAYAAEFEKPLFESGKMELGMNFWPSETATKMWRDWRPESIEKDLATLEKYGVTVLRVFPVWSDFQPIVEVRRNSSNYNLPYDTRMTLDELPLPDTPAGRAGVDETMCERFEAFCRMAERHNMKLIVAIMTGQMTFRNFIPPALDRMDPYHDPVALEWEARFLEYFVGRFKGEKCIAAWESGNESRVLGAAKERAEGAVWLRYIHNVIRLADPSRPIIGVDSFGELNTGAWRVKDVAEQSDWTPHHLYELWKRASVDNILDIRSSFFCASRTSALEDISGKPSFLEEHGVRRAEVASPANIAKYLHTAMWNMWAEDCKALVWWCAFDQTTKTIAPYEWADPCLELGIFAEDRKPYPAVETASRFIAFLKKLPFEALPKAKSDAVFLISDETMAHASYILARQAGIMPEYQDARDKLRDASVYFIPSVSKRGNISTSRWQELLSKVRDGATVFLSFDQDCFLPQIPELCGAQIETRTVEGGKGVFSIGDASFSLPRTFKPVYSSCGAEILGKDESGNPVFFRHNYGKGTVYTMTFPVERWAYKAVRGFDTDAYKVYAEVLKTDPLLKNPSRDVTVSQHFFNDSKAALLVVNNGEVPYQGKPALKDGWRVRSSHTDDNSTASWKSGVLKLEGHSAILLVVEK